MTEINKKVKFNMKTIQEIIKNDMISRIKTGISPIKEMKLKTDVYWFFKFFTNSFGLTSLSLLFFYITKRYTYRNVYLYSLLFSSSFFLLCKVQKDCERKKLIELYNCEESDVDSFINFYHYAVIENENAYNSDEANKKI